MTTIAPPPPAPGTDYFTFICTDCGREERSPALKAPQGWDFLAADCSGAGFARCPDCAEKNEQDKIAQLRAEYSPAWMGIDSGALAFPKPHAFHLFLEKQDDGRYLINVQPEAALMRMHPLAFFLDAQQARELADDMLRHAAMLKAPGTAPLSPAQTIERLLGLLMRGTVIVDQEIEQRQHGGNPQYLAALEAWSGEAHGAIAQIGEIAL